MDDLDQLRLDHAFVSSNDSKAGRERWVVDQWLMATGRNGVSVAVGGEPPDLVVAGIGIEVVEVLEAGRKRSAEYAARVNAQVHGTVAPRRRRPGLPKVQKEGHAWVLREVLKKSAKAYDREASREWTLLVYANFFWAENVQWDLVASQLEGNPPPFASVEVVFALGTGPAVALVFNCRSGP